MSTVFDEKYNLKYVADGYLYPMDTGKNIQFKHQPRLSITQNMLLIAGALDYGIVIVALETGHVVHTQTELRGECLGVCASNNKVFVITPTRIFLYSLCSFDDSLMFESMAPIARLDNTDHFYTGVAAINPRQSVLYVKTSNGTDYSIHKIHYADHRHEVLYTDKEINITAITHIFYHNSKVYGVQGSVGVLCDIEVPTNTISKIQECVFDVFGTDAHVVSTRVGYKGVAVWSDEMKHNDHFEIGIDGVGSIEQNTAVAVSGNTLVTLDVGASLMHVFSIVSHATTATTLFERQVCQRVLAVSLLNPVENISMFLGDNRSATKRQKTQDFNTFSVVINTDTIPLDDISQLPVDSAVAKNIDLGFLFSNENYFEPTDDLFSFDQEIIF